MLGFLEDELLCLSFQKLVIQESTTSSLVKRHTTHATVGAALKTDAVCVRSATGLEDFKDRQQREKVAKDHSVNVQRQEKVEHAGSGKSTCLPVEASPPRSDGGETGRQELD